MGLLEEFIASLLLLLSSKEIWQIAGLSLLISITAVTLSSLVGVPLGIRLGNSKARRPFLTILINTGMGLPPVLVGLVIFLLFARSGPLGSIRILFTPLAMITAQFILTLPIIIGVTRSTIAEIPEDLPDTLISMGASNEQMKWGILFQSRVGILTGITLAMGRAFSEVGAILIVGGNIRYQTRVLTTAIITEVSKGENETALALGLILILISFSITSLLTILQFKSD